MALHRSQHINATLNGAAVAPGQLDQNRIAKAEFHVEKATLGGQGPHRVAQALSGFWA